MSYMDLRRYRSVAEGKAVPRYRASAHQEIGPVTLSDADTHELWRLHDEFRTRKSGASVLDLKIELAERMLKSCSLCERRCGADRAAGELGFCGVSDSSRYTFEQILVGEEAPVIPSHEVFFSGCNMRCAYCYSWESVLDPARGKEIEPWELAELMDSRREEGAVNVNLIGGEPTVNLSFILKALRKTRNPTAVVWNSNFLMSEETMRLLDGVVDLYLGDFRFGNDRCASKLASTKRYYDVAGRNFLLAAESGDLIIRHLVVPGHVECCLLPIAEWVSKNMPDVPFHLMFQYTPYFKAVGDPVLGRSLTAEEIAKAQNIAGSFGLNTERWNRPLKGKRVMEGIGSGEVSTTITILPDGKVSIQRLHGDLKSFAALLSDGGKH